MAKPTIDLALEVRRRVESSIVVKQRLLTQLGPAEVAVVEVFIAAFRAGHKLILFGNGGSAADAQHIAAEFVGRYYFDRPALPAIALTDNASSLTAVANDYAFSRVFARQIEALGRAGDIALGLSTSGDSSNVIEAIRAAKQRRMVTIALTGETGGALKLEEPLDYCIRAPSTDTPRVQEVHMLLCHTWAELVEDALFGGRAVDGST